MHCASWIIPVTCFSDSVFPSGGKNFFPATKMSVIIGNDLIKKILNFDSRKRCYDSICVVLHFPDIIQCIKPFLPLFVIMKPDRLY